MNKTTRETLGRHPIGASLPTTAIKGRRQDIDSARRSNKQQCPILGAASDGGSTLYVSPSALLACSLGWPLGMFTGTPRRDLRLIGRVDGFAPFPKPGQGAGIGRIGVGDSFSRSTLGRQRAGRWRATRDFRTDVQSDPRVVTTELEDNVYVCSQK
jgi:hypothetical protein